MADKSIVRKAIQARVTARAPVTRSACAALLLVAASIGLLGAGCGYSEEDFANPHLAVIQDFGPPPSSVDKRLALQVLRHDRSLRVLLKGAHYRVVTALKWNRLSGARLGVALDLRLTRPVALLDADLPYISIPPDAPALGDCRLPYAQGWMHEYAEHLTGVSVMVDLEKKSVVEIRTNSRRSFHPWVEGKPHPHCEEVLTA